MTSLTDFAPLLDLAPSWWETTQIRRWTIDKMSVESGLHESQQLVMDIHLFFVCQDGFFVCFLIVYCMET